MEKDCLKAAAGLIDADSFWYVERVDELMAAGAEQQPAQRRAAGELLQRITGERGQLGRFAGVFTAPSQWSEEAFAGAMRFNARDGFAPPTVRQQMNSVLAARNRGLQRVNPASVLEADIDRAARALALVVGEIRAGRYEQTEAPIGPMPHVLHMLGAPMQMVQMNTSIVRKILVDKHSEDFADITPRQLVEGIYKPAMVTQARAANEYEVTTDMVAKGGNPITAVIKVDTVQPVASGKPLKVASVLSAYARNVMGPGDTLLQRVLTGKLRYVELERAQQAVGKGWARFQPSLTTALANRTVKGELDLVKFIGDNYRPESSPAGWDDAPAFSRREDVTPLGFYSELLRKVEALGPAQAKPDAWKALVRAMPGKGVKAEEIEWSGIGDWLDMQGDRKVAKAEVLDFVRGNGVQVDEVVLDTVRRETGDTLVFGDPTAALEWLSDHLGLSQDEVRAEWGYADDGDYIELAENMANSEGVAPPGAKYGNYTLPGGDNYREVLLTLTRDPDFTIDDFIDEMAEKYGRAAIYDTDGNYSRIKPSWPAMLSLEDQSRLAAAEKAMPPRPEPFVSSHWGGVKDILAHVRVNDRTDTDGKRVLFVEELQSDWGQQGKRMGFTNQDTSGINQELLDQLYATNPRPGIPAAPFVTKTDGWLNLSLKRVVAMAVDGGYDRVAFVTGEQSAERYSLSKQVDSIKAKRFQDGTYYVEARVKGGGRDINESNIGESELEGLVGKEMATKIVEATKDGGRPVTFEGLDLKVGGEGMRAFYDKIVPNAVKALVKKLGGQQASVKLSLDSDASNNEEREWNEASVRAVLARGGDVYVVADGQENRVRTAEQLDELMAESEPAGYILGDIGGTTEQPGFDVTDAMREKVDAGLPLFSRRQGDAPEMSQSLRSNRPGRYSLRNFNIGHQVIEAIQNRYNRWKQAIEDIRQQGGQISEANDFYRAEERYWGKVGARIDDFKERIEAFIDEVAKDKLTLDDVALYAYAQHAPERNAWIASQRASMPDGGSGMMTQDALDIIDEARVSGLQPLLDKHAATLRTWIQGTRDILFNEGLIDQNEHDAWTNMFQDYVPLRGLEGMPEQRGTGQGFNIRGREGKAAMGRKSQARQIIEQIVLDRSKALIRSGKNEVLRSFARFVLDNPSPNLWEINAVETKPFTSVDANGNRIIDEKQTIIADDRTVTVKDGGREIHILVNDDKLLEQLRNLNADNPSMVVGALLFVNRILARLYTSMNPVFTVLNGARDFQAATVGMIDDIGFMAVPRLWANMPTAMVEAYRAEAGSYSPDYQDYRNTGGKTGFFDFKTIDAQTAELQALLADADRSIINPRKLGPKAMALIESFNAGIENATRLAAFKTARQMGRSLAEAAHISKNITVNFNRRGTMTPTLAAYFLFFNPAVQGTARIAQAMTSPKVVGTMGLAMLGVAALAMRNAGMGEDDDGVAWWDKIPDEVKERNLVIVLPPGASGGEQVKGSTVGRYVKIPMPYGYNFFAVVANQMVDVWRNSQDPRRGRGAMSGMAKSFTAFMGAWLPISELGRSFETPQSAVLAAVPDALNPLAQVAINTSTFGREMRPEDRTSQYNPDSSKYFAGQAGTIFQRAAEQLNSITGGDRYQSGLIDIAPSTLEAIARGYGGGPVTFAMDWVNAFYARQSIERTSPRYEALPFAKQLYGVIDAETDRMVGYQRLEEASKIVEPMRRARREGGALGREAVDEMRGEFGPMLALGGAIDDARLKLSEVRKRELAIISGPETEAVKYAKLQEMALRRRQVLQRFNAAYDRAIVAADAAKRQPEGQ